MNEDLSMMLSPDRWPLWPHLPLKKPNPDGGFPLTAIFVQLGNGHYAFFQDDIWRSRLGRSELVGEPQKGGRELAERLVNDGWVVD